MAIANSRLVSLDERGVCFRWKDYRAKGETRHKTMTLKPDEFMRRFLLHVLPGGFHRIRHFGLIVNANRKEGLELSRQLLSVPAPDDPQVKHTDANDTVKPAFVCAHCGAAMQIVETFLRGQSIRAPPRDMAAP